MQLLRLAITFLTLATATATSAQNGYVINGTVIDVTAPTDPKFSSDPRIVLTILQFEKQRSNPTTDTLLAEQLLVSVNDNQHTFKRTLVPLTRWTRTYAYLDVWFDNGDYVPVDLVSHHRQLPAEVASDGKVTMALKFIPRKNLAISRQTESIRSLDKSNLGPGDFERSDGLARTAIELALLLIAF